MEGQWQLLQKHYPKGEQQNRHKCIILPNRFSLHVWPQFQKNTKKSVTPCIVPHSLPPDHYCSSKILKEILKKNTLLFKKICSFPLDPNSVQWIDSVEFSSSFGTLFGWERSPASLLHSCTPPPASHSTRANGMGFGLADANPGRVA